MIFLNEKVFINFAKSKRGSENDDEVDEMNESESEDEIEIGGNKLDDEIDEQIRVNFRALNRNNTIGFDSIKNHFNSLKKSKHIRKTSSAKSHQKRQSIRSKNSQKSSLKRSISNCDNGFTNLAYEIEFKNSSACEFPLQENFYDKTNSFNEDGEYFSKC